MCAYVSSGPQNEHVRICQFWTSEMNMCAYVSSGPQNEHVRICQFWTTE
jgi:hypothetical protein